jgi:hypothetical protein
MGNRTDERSQTSRPGIAKILDSAHLHICRAGFLIVTLIVKRRLWKSYVEEAQHHLAKAQEKLGELDDWTKRS